MKTKFIFQLLLLTIIPFFSKAQSNGVIVAGGNGDNNAANQLYHPTSIYVDAAGNIYIADYRNHRIQKWAPNATEGITVAGGNGQGDASNQLNYPNGVYVDQQGNIYVADTENNRVQKWVPNATEGLTVAGGNGPGDASNQLYYPMDVFIDSNNDLIVADSFNGRVQKWANGAMEGTTIAGGNSRGGALNQLDFITSLFVTPNNDIYVTQGGEAQGLRKWHYSATEGENLNTTLNIYYPRGVFVDNNNNIFVGTFDNNVIKINQNLTQFDILAGGGGTLNSFSGPSDIFFDSSGHLYVADTYNNRVLKFTPPFGCQLADDVTSNSATINSFNIEWTGNSGKSYLIRYKKQADTEWTESTSLLCSQDGTMQYQINYLEAGTNYEFQIKTICSYVMSSQYSNSYIQATLPLAPNISILEAQPSCLGAVNHLEATNCTGTIIWSNGITGTSLTVSPIQSTSYTATCKLNNVLSANSNTITVDILKDKSVSLTPYSGFCIQNFLSMYVQLDTTSFKINWYKNGQNVDNLNSSTLKSLFTRQVAANTDLGVYHATIEKKEGNCIVQSDTLNVVFNPIELPIVKDTTIERGAIFNAHIEGCSNTTRWYKFPVRVPGRSSDFVIDGTDINAGYIFSDTTLYVACYNNCESGRANYNIKVINAANTPNSPTLSVNYQYQCTPGPSATITATGCSGTVSFFKRDLFGSNQLELLSTSATAPYNLAIGYSNTIYASCEVNGVKSPLASINIKQKYSPEPNIYFSPVELNSYNPLKVNINSNVKVEVISSQCSDVVQWYDASNSSLLNSGNSFQITNFNTNKQYYATCSSSINGCPIRKYFTINTDESQPYIYPLKSRFSICNSGNTNLEVLGCAGGNISWYSSETSTNSLGTGTSFQTPVYSNITNSNQFYSYWVACSKNSQEIRKEVSLVVAPAPNNIVAKDSVLDCNTGDAYIKVSGCNTSYEFYQTSSGFVNISNQSLSHFDPLFTNQNRVYQLKCKNTSAECSSPTKEITVFYNCTPPLPPTISQTNQLSSMPEPSNTQNTIFNTCIGSEIKLVASGCPNGKVLWKDGDLVLNKTFLVNKDIYNIYAYCVDDKNVISPKSSLVSIIASPKPVIQINGSLVMTINNTFDLTNPIVTSGSSFPIGTTISYYKNSDLSITLPNPQNLLSAGVYYLKATTPVGCFSSTQAIIKANCSSVYSLISPNDDVSEGDFIKKSIINIDMKNKITGTAKIEATSTKAINLLPGFTVNPANNGVFKAVIGACD